MQHIFLERAIIGVTNFMKRYPRTFLLLAYAVVLFPLYVPLLIGVLIYVPGDTLGFNYPPLKALQSFSITSLLADPFSGRGFPWLVTYGTLDPIAHILRILFDPYVTLAWLCYLYLILGAWLFSLFLRRHALSIGASFIGGLIYMGAFFWYADGDYPLASSLPFFAGMLFASSFLRTHPLRAFLGLSLTIGYAWLAGHFNFVPFMVIAIAVISFMQSVHSSEHSIFKRVQPFFLFCVATAIGSLIGLIKLIPALATVAHSIRAGGLSVDTAGQATLMISGLYTALFPYMTIPFLDGELGMLFFGAAGLALLIIGALQRSRKVRLAIWGLAICLLITMPYSPLYTFIQTLPFFSFLRGPRRWLLLANACVGFIAACAADDIQFGRLQYVRGTGRVLLIIGGAAAIASVAISAIDAFYGEAIVRSAQQYFDAHYYAQTSGLPLEHYHRHIAQLWKSAVGNFSLMSLRFMAPLIGLLLTGWVLHYRILRMGNRLPLLACIVIFSFLPSFFLYHPKTPAAELSEIRQIWSKASLGEAPVLPLLSGIADQIVRTGVVGDNPSERVRYQIGLLVPNTQSLVGIHSVDFYQPIQPRRMGRLLAALGSAGAPAPTEERLILGKTTPEEKIQTISERLGLIERMGVAYVSSVWDVPAPFVHHQSLSFVKRLPDIQLYKVPNPNPFAFIPSSITIQTPNEESAIAYVRDMPNTSPALIECVSCEAGEEEQGSGSVVVAQNAPTSVVLDVDVSSDAFMKVLRPRLPGWRVYVDGIPTKTAIGDALFFAIPVPAGEHELRLEITYSTLLIDSAKQLLCQCDPWQL